MKVRRYLLLLVIGGLIGGVIGGGMDSISSLIANTSFSHTQNMIIFIISSLLIIGLTLYLWKVQNDALKFKRHSLQSIEDDDADTYERKANLKYNQAKIIIYLQMTISFLCVLLIVLGKGSDYDILYVVIPLLLTSIPSIMDGFFNRRFDTRFPKIGEKDYTEKTLNLLDDGERHIALLGMYKNYQINLVLLMVGIMFLGIYAMGTGSNQTLGILFLTIAFIYNSFGYLLKVREFYKS
ncbi:DUF3169 family protein [Staphylococcus devriesei]|uniref:DUF3169 family protein n=1 Tax=Staphylococcus devriesei TaxID=586733 RepID=UPI001F2B87CA|nr:DUF3169 family protein [Staphylococcus devriesei]MCE5090429.1 DUF3169 family protein [Staphylococcus devriesei]